MKIHFVRHGDPDYTTDTLTESGRAEAKCLSEYLATIPVDLLYTSPIPRARETASYTESLLEKEAVVLDWAEEIKLEAPDGSDFMAWYMSPEHYRDENYNKIEDWNKKRSVIEQSSDDWIESLGWKKNSHLYHFQPDKNISKDIQVVLFSHGGIGLTWIAHLLQIPYHVMWSSFFLHTSSMTTILFDERTTDKATPRIIGFSNLPHLHKDGLKPSRTGIKANYL
jgi:broad specificity phosphatase PhoE